MVANTSRIGQVLILFFFLCLLLATNGQFGHCKLVLEANAPAGAKGRSALATAVGTVDKGSVDIIGVDMFVTSNFGEDNVASIPTTTAMSTMPGHEGTTTSSSSRSATATSAKSSVSVIATSSSQTSAHVSSSEATATPFITMSAGDPVSQPDPHTPITMKTSKSPEISTSSMSVPDFTASETSSSLPPITSAWSQPTLEGNSTAASNPDGAPTVPIAIGVSVSTLIIVSAGMLVYLYILKKRREQPARAESPPPYDTDIGVGAAILAPDTPVQSVNQPKNGPGTSMWEPPIELVNRPAHPMTLAPGNQFPVSRQEFPKTRLPRLTPPQLMNFTPAVHASPTYPQPTRSPHPMSLTPGVFHPIVAHHELPAGQVDPLRSSPPVDYFPPHQSYNARGPLEPVDERYEMA